MALPEIGDDELFFGSQPVRLAQVPDRAFGFCSKHWKQGTDAESLEQTFGNAQEQTTEDGQVVVVPGIPAVDSVPRNKDIFLEQPSNYARLPAFLQQPCLKVPLQEDDATEDASASRPKAVASGVRSALVKCLDSNNNQQRWYRLKGCGKHDEGLTVRRNVGKEDRIWHGVRGSAFWGTTARELNTTHRLSTLLEGTGVVSANQSIGFFCVRRAQSSPGTTVPNLLHCRGRPSRRPTVWHARLGGARVGFAPSLGRKSLEPGGTAGVWMP